MANDTSNSAGGGKSFYDIGHATTTADLAPSGGVLGGLDNFVNVLKEKQLAAETEEKAIHTQQAKDREQAGKDITLHVQDMDETMKALPASSLQQAQSEVEVLRQEMFAAIDADDPKAIADVNTRLKEIKSRHSSDAEELTTFMDQWDGELVSHAGTRKEDLELMKNFVDKNNKSRKTVYKGVPPVLHYEWDTLVNGEQVPMLDANLEPTFNADGTPAYEQESVTLAQLNGMIVPSDNANGMGVMDYVENSKTLMKEGKNAPGPAAIRKEMRKIVPTDANQLRDWTYGNPAGADGLDVFGYLMEHDLLNGQYEALGIEDLNPPEGIGPEDWDSKDNIVGQDKKAMIDAIMNVENPAITHDIISDIYATLSFNNINKIEYNEATGEGNKDYHPERHELLNVPTQKRLDEREQKANQEKLTKLQSLADPEVLKGLGGANTNEIAKKLNLDPNEKILNPKTGEMETIATYIANATKKKAGSGGVGGQFVGE